MILLMRRSDSPSKCLLGLWRWRSIANAHYIVCLSIGRESMGIHWFKAIRVKKSCGDLISAEICRFRNERETSANDTLPLLSVVKNNQVSCSLESSINGM